MAQARHDESHTSAAVGNLALSRALGAHGIQAKVGISQPGEPEELEADRVADSVVNAAQAPPISRAAVSREAPQRLPSGSRVSGTGAVAAAASAVRTGGMPLSRDVRAALEPRFAHDFSAVRIHTDPAAAEAARSIGARAYTLGTHIAFAPGHFRPTERDGQHLLAHELTHTIQQAWKATTPTLGKSSGAHVARDSNPPSLDTSAPPPATSDFNFVTLPDEPDLFAVPEDSSRMAVAGRLLGDAQLVASVQFIATGKIPVLDNKPARAARVTDAGKLVPAALTVLQHGLDVQLDADVATVISILEQRLIGGGDELKLTEITLRWSQRSDIKSPVNANYFAAYLQRLNNVNLTESFLGISGRKKTALEWLIIEAEEKAEQIRKAIELRAPEFSVGYTVTDARPEFQPGDIIGRFYYSGGGGSVQIAVAQTIANEPTMQRADIVVRNSPATGLRVLVPGGGRVYGYAILPFLVNDPLVTHPALDFKGHYYWYYPGTVLTSPGGFEKEFVPGGEQEKQQRTELLVAAIAQATAANPWPLYGLDYDVLSIAAPDQQIAMVRTVLAGPGASDLRGNEFIARVIEATPKAGLAALEARLDSEGLLDRILALSNPTITHALGPRLTTDEKQNLDRLEGMTDVYALYKRWKTSVQVNALLGSGFTPASTGTAVGSTGSISDMTAELEAALREDGFASIAEFETANRKFIEGFRRFALQEAFKILDDNEALIRGEYARYAGTAAGGGIVELRGAIGPLKAKVDAWDAARKRTQQANLSYGMSFSPAGGTYRPPRDQVDKAKAEESAAEKEMRDVVTTLSGRFPVLADPQLDLVSVVHADDATLSALLQTDAEARLRDIDKARGALNEKPDRIWKMEGAIARARVAMGMVEGSIYDQMLNDELSAQKSDEFFEGLLTALLAIGLGLVSAGGGTVAVLAATAGAGISAYTAVSHIQKFQVAQAAAGTAFDRAQALSSDEPSYFWLAVDVAAAILDLGMAAKAFSKLKPLAQGAVDAADEATRIARLKELESAAKELEAEARALEKAKQAAETGSKAAEDLKKAGAAGAKAAEPAEQLAPKVLADTKARISGKEALEKLGAQESAALKALVQGDEAAAGGLARIEPGVRAKVLQAIKSPAALRKLGNAVQESEHALESVEALHNVFVGKLNRPDQFKAILEKYLLSRQAKQAEIFHVIGEAGLTENDLAKIGAEIAGSKSAKGVGTRFGNLLINEVSDKLPGGGEGIQKVLSISERVEQGTKGSIFEKWARKHIYPEGLGRFEAAAKDLPGQYSKSKVITDSFREIASPPGNAIIEFKNIEHAHGFTAGTGEGAQLANYKQLIDNGVKASNGKPFVAVEYLFSNRAAAEAAAGQITGLFGDAARIFYVDLQTGLKAAL